MFAAVMNYVPANPELTFSYDPPDGKLGWLIRVVATQRLQISATVKLSRLTVDTGSRRHRDRFGFASLITPGPGRPMSIYRRANIVLVDLFDHCPPHDIGYYTTPLHKPRRPVIASNFLDTEPRQSNAGATPVRLGHRTSHLFALLHCISPRAL